MSLKDFVSPVRHHLLHHQELRLRKGQEYKLLVKTALVSRLLTAGKHCHAYKLASPIRTLSDQHA